MSLSAREIKMLIIKAVIDMAEGGVDSLRSQYRELAGPGLQGIDRVVRESYLTRDLWEGMRLADAVVVAVTKATRCVDARGVLELLRDHPHIAREPDERYKRRKISQALYGQKGKALRSYEIHPGVFVWGLPEWFDEETGELDSEFEPLEIEDDEEDI